MKAIHLRFVDFFTRVIVSLILVCLGYYLISYFPEKNQNILYIMPPCYGLWMFFGYKAFIEELREWADCGGVVRKALAGAFAFFSFCVTIVAVYISYIVLSPAYAVYWIGYLFGQGVLAARKNQQH